MTRQKWTKLLALVVVACFAAMMFAGCQKQPAAEPTTAPTQAPASSEPGTEPSAEPAADKDPSEYTGTIQFWCWDSTWGNLMTPAFMEKYTNITAEFTPVQYNDYLQKIQTSMAAGTELPDVLAGEYGFRARSYALGIWENLEQAPYNVDRNDMFEYLIPGCEYEGNIVGLEMQISPAAMAFRRDVAIEHLGFTDDDTMEEQMEAKLKTYDDILTVGKELLEKSDGKVGMFPSCGDVFDFIARQQTAPLMPDEKTLDVTTRVKAMYETMVEWNDAGIIGTYENGTPAYQAVYDTSDFLLYPMPSWRCTSVKDEYAPNSAGQFCLFVPPGGTYSWGGTVMGIYNESAQKEAAWKYVEFGTWSLDGAQEVSVARGYQTSKKELYEQDETLGSRYDDYWKQDLFAFWIRDDVMEVKTSDLCPYDSIVLDACSVANNRLQADSSLRAEDLIAIVIEETQNKVPADITVK